MPVSLACGRIKTGKTVLALHLAWKHAPGRAVIWDSKHNIKGAVYVYDADSLENAIQDDEGLRGFIVFRPDGRRIKEDFSSMAEILFTPPDRFESFSLVVDEAAQLQGPQYIEPYLDVAIRQHPRGANVYQTTHSLQDWHRASKDLMSDLYCFKLQGRSLAAVIDYTDGDEEMRETIATLPDHHLVHYSFERGTWEVWDDPTAWDHIEINGQQISLIGGGNAEGTNPGGERLVGSGRELRARPGGRRYAESSGSPQSSAGTGS